MIIAKPAGNRWRATVFGRADRVRRAIQRILILAVLTHGPMGLAVTQRASGAEPEADQRAAAGGRPAGKRPARPSRVGKLVDEGGPAIEYLTAEQARRLGAVSFAGVNTPFRQALRNLSRTLRLAIVVDRRLNPDQVVDLDIINVPLVEALQQIAREAGGDATLMGSVAYIGPANTARQLRTLCALRTQDAQRLPAGVRAAALASRPLAWHALTTPAEILKQLGDDADIEILGLDQVPHDLLAATDLPALPWVDRLSLVAAQLGLTFQFARGGRTIELVPIGENVRLTRNYPSGGGAASTVAAWKSLAPEAEIAVSGGRIVVRARVEDHERLVPPKASRAAGAAATVGQQVYTLKMEHVPLDNFLAQLAEKVGLRVDLDRVSLAAAGITPDRELNVDVENASLDELLRAALEPLDLEFARKDNAVTVTARKKQ